MGMFDFLGSTKRDMDIKKVDKWNPEQKAMFQDMSGYNRGRIGNYSGTYDALLSGRPSTTVNSQTTRQYFDNSIRPELEDNFNRSLDQTREKYKNAWSTARFGAEDQLRQEHDDRLAKTYHDLLYQDEQARRNLAESGMQRSLGAQQSISPQQRLLQMLGLEQYDIIANQQPSEYDKNMAGMNSLINLIGAGGSVAGAVM